MPPALSDEENGVSSGEEEIPYRGKGKAANEDPVDEDDEQSENEEGEDGDDEFVVEKIVTHKIANGETQYRVKWLGYEKKSDQTWEPESNLEGVEALQEYWESIGGRPEAVKGKKRKGRPSAAESETGTPASTSKRTKKEKEWSPPPGSWEHDVDYVETVEESLDNATGKPARFAYLVWINQKKSQHPLHHVYTKCPQKMLKYYESHLVFTHSNSDDLLNGDDKEVAMKGDTDSPGPL